MIKQALVELLKFPELFLLLRSTSGFRPSGPFTPTASWRCEVNVTPNQKKQAASGAALSRTLS